MKNNIFFVLLIFLSQINKKKKKYNSLRKNIFLIIYVVTH